MLHAQSIAKSFGHQTVLQDLSWHIGRGARIGLVGPNGAGKTTLIRILAGLDAPDAGEVTVPKGAVIGYLPQEVETLGGSTVLGQALIGFTEVRGIEEELERIEAALAETASEGGAREADGAVRRPARFGSRRSAGTALEGEARAILGGLGFAPGAMHAAAHDALGRLADAGRARAAPPAASRPPAPRRADEPPRPRVARLARGVPRRVRRERRRRQPRPLLPEPRGATRSPSSSGGAAHAVSPATTTTTSRRSRRASEALLRRASATRTAQIARDRAVHRALPLQGDQGAAGPEPRQAARRRWSGSACAAAVQDGPLRVSPAAARRAETIRVEGLRKAYGENVVYDGASFVAPARRQDRARRAQRRGQDRRCSRCWRECSRPTRARECSGTT